MVKSWLVQDQIVLGKDYSNLLIADSLLKTIWFINAPCYGNEALTSPKANGFGKDKSNPLIVGSLLKTTREPRVHVPNVLTTHPTLHLDSDFTLSSDSIGSDLVVYFPFGTRNKIFNPRIFHEVQSKRFLSPNEFSISFIRDPLSQVFDTLLPFSSENEEKDFNPGSLSSNEAKSPLFAYVVWIFLPFLTYPVAPPYLLSSGNEDTIFDPGISIYHSFMPGVSHRSGTFMKFNDCPDFEASRAHGFVLRSLELQILSFIMGIQYPNLID
ncbi:hypothetical protein Tco_0573253 [Tanacetum coccineum]